MGQAKELLLDLSLDLWPDPDPIKYKNLIIYLNGCADVF